MASFILGWMHRFGMLWNFNSLAQLLQGGPGALGNASCAYDRPPFQQRICLQGRWNAAWCTGCFTRNVYSPRTYFATYESWFFFMLYTTSVLIDTYSMDFLQVFVSVASATTRSPVPYCSLVSWQVETRSSSLVTLGFRGRQMWPSVSLQWYCLGLQMAAKNPESTWYEVYSFLELFDGAKLFWDMKLRREEHL